MTVIPLQGFAQNATGTSSSDFFNKHGVDRTPLPAPSVSPRPMPTPSSASAMKSQFLVLPPAEAPVAAAQPAKPVQVKAAVVKKPKPKRRNKWSTPPPPQVVVIQVPPAPQPAPVPVVQATPAPTPAPKKDIYEKDLAGLELNNKPTPMPKVIYKTSMTTRETINLGKNALTAEGAGRAGYYSVNYDRMTGSHVALGLGFSYMSTRMEDERTTQLNFAMAPIYANFYFLPDEHRPFFTIGATVLHISGDIEKNGEVEKTIQEKLGDGFTGIGAVPHAGIGYEFRSGTGFLGRLAVYGGYIHNQVIPWGGLSLGTAF